MRVLLVFGRGRRIQSPNLHQSEWLNEVQHSASSIKFCFAKFEGFFIVTVTTK